MVYAWMLRIFEPEAIKQPVAVSRHTALREPSDAVLCGRSQPAGVGASSLATHSREALTMAVFAAVIDRSPERRRRFLDRARRDLDTFFPAPAASFERGDLVVVSWTASFEPFRCAESAESAAFVWGHAREQAQRAPAHADIAHVWRTLPERVPPPLEGMHAALCHRADGTSIVGADLFGVMPIYYASGRDYVIVASSPEPFRSHPDFVAELDPAGLAGILLSNGLVGGRALLKGVRRLAPGALLLISRDGMAREVHQYRPEMSDRYFGDTYEKNYERMAEALDDCFARHVDPQQPYGLLLSGGLDSRLVAGILKRRGVSFKAFSFGSPRDIEVQCATGAAKALRAEHEVLPIRMDRYVEYAHNECKWKHLSNGFTTINNHEPIADSARFSAGLLSGYVFENVIGAEHISFGKDPGAMSYELIFKKLNRWGLPIPTIKRLLAKICAPSVVDAAAEELEHSYRSGAAVEWQRAWLFGHYFRGRFHVSGVLGLHRRWPWPVVPYIDTKLLDLMAGMPYEHVHTRRMQYHMLKTEFPELARVPLDRNSFRMQSVLPRYGRWVDRMVRKPREYFYQWTRAIHDRRFYFRVMSFNSPGWIAVREAVEPYRGKALQVLDEAVLADVLARPGDRRAVDDSVEDSSKAKLMAGFLLWSAAYL
jgi:asparagine synthase (glutamine-hydrolysing)